MGQAVLLRRGFGRTGMGDAAWAPLTTYLPSSWLAAHPTSGLTLAQVTAMWNNPANWQPGAIFYPARFQAGSPTASSSPVQAALAIVNAQGGVLPGAETGSTVAVDSGGNLTVTPPAATAKISTTTPEALGIGSTYIYNGDLIIVKTVGNGGAGLNVLSGDGTNTPVNLPIGTTFQNTITADSYTVSGANTATLVSAGSSSASAAGASTQSLAAATLQAGNTYYYNDGTRDYAIQVLSIGSGGPGLSVQSGEGSGTTLNLPIGSTYIDSVDGNTYQVTGTYSATLVTPGSGSSASAAASANPVINFSIDASGNLTWQFDPSAPQPYEIAYSADGGNSWQNALAAAAPVSGTISVAGLPGGVNYIFVMHDANGEIARVYYTPGSAGTSTATLTSSDQGAASSILPASVSSAVSTAENWFTESTLISGIPNWGTAAAGVLGVWLLFFKKKR